MQLPRDYTQGPPNDNNVLALPYLGHLSPLRTAQHSRGSPFEAVVGGDIHFAEVAPRAYAVSSCVQTISYDLRALDFKSIVRFRIGSTARSLGLPAAFLLS